VPDDRKKKISGANSGQGSFSNSQGSWPDEGHAGPSKQKSGTSAKCQEDKVNAGDINSPVKPKPRPRKPRASTQINNGKASAVVKGDTRRVTGQKRKDYRQKVQPAPDGTEPVENLSTNMPQMAIVLASTDLPATTGGGSDHVDSNKKYKLDNNVTQIRSADQAAAVMQPRPTQ
jgi:hypothetical protein